MKDILELAIGFTALTFGLFYRVPQIYKLYFLKNGTEISEKMLHIQNISYVLYVVYGVLRNDIVYISSSVIGVLQNLIIFGMKRWYAYKESLSSSPV